MLHAILVRFEGKFSCQLRACPLISLRLLDQSVCGQISQDTDWSTIVSTLSVMEMDMMLTQQACVRPSQIGQLIGSARLPNRLGQDLEDFQIGSCDHQWYHDVTID